MRYPTNRSNPVDPEGQSTLDISLHEDKLPIVTEQAVARDDELRRSSTFSLRYFTQLVVTLPGLQNTAVQSPGARFFILSVGVLFLLLLLLIGIASAIAASVVTVSDPNRRGAAAPQPSVTGSSPIRRALSSDFPDPSIWLDNGTWYAFATNTDTNSTAAYMPANIQMATSTNFVDWTLIPVPDDPLPTLGAWTAPNLRNEYNGITDTWAPGLLQRADGKFVMYYSSPTAGRNPHPAHPVPHCIGAALSIAQSPAGPYTPQNTSLFCPVNVGGAIDAEGFADADGSLYVVYKVDSNNIGNGGTCGNTHPLILPTLIILQRMVATGLEPFDPSTKPITLLNRQTSDGPLIEAPKLIRTSEGIYFLFYSSGCTYTSSYTVKFATATAVGGPYTRNKHDTPLLKSKDWGLESPGSVGVHQDAQGKWYLAFHASITVEGGGSIRQMFTSGLKFDGHSVSLVAVDAL